jgi:hypothetical protein
MVENEKKKFDKALLWDYFILVARIWLAYTLLRYGWSKLIGGQFYVTEATLHQPLKDIDLFRVSWYLAGHEPFNSFVGISQILTAGLLIFNRTAIIGAFMSIPIWINILMWDMTFMALYTGFTVRISFYLLLTFLIIWHYKDKVLFALQTLIKGTSTRFKFPIWAYLLIIPFGFLLKVIGGIPIAIIYYIKQIFK